MAMTRKLTVGLLCAAATVLVATGSHASRATDEYYQSDAADYARAAKVGFWGLYAETHTSSLRQLYSLYKTNPRFKAHPFDYLYEAADAASLRHYHGPGSMYLLAVTAQLGMQEQQQRLLLGLIGAMSCGLVVWLLWRLGAGPALALGAGLLGAFDLRNVFTDLEPNPVHTVYIFVSLLLFAVAVEWMQRGRPRWLLYAGAMLLAMATVTFELVPALWLSIACAVAVAVWKRVAFKEWVGTAVRFAVAYLVAIAVCWPGGFLKGSLPFCFVGNLTILGRQHSTEPTSLAAVFKDLLGPYPLYVVLLAVVALAALFVLSSYLRKGQRPEPIHVAIAVNGVVTVLFGIASHFKNVQYFTEAMFPALLLSGLIVHLAAERVGGALRIATAVVLFAAVGLLIVKEGGTPFRPGHYRELVSDIRRTAQPGDGTLLVNDINALNALRLYLPGYKFEITASPAELAPRHAEVEPSIRRVLIYSSAMDAATLQQAKQRFPLQAVYDMSGRQFWLGTRKSD